jgi:50S ribosomal protein L16 3-hydroxylase
MPHLPDPSTLLGGLTVDEFLAEYWQRRPLLVRGAMPDFVSPLSPEELAGLACEEVAPARLVLERGGERPWTVRHGPFTEADFTALPESHYSLLVTDCEKLLPDLTALIDPFRFVPDWRIDDLMISYAPEGGSVGPHVDQYDVFLLQGYGRRRWQISARTDYDPSLLEGPELAILARFEPHQEWVLEPGDLLYLPPGIPHHGVALGPCMTYSIGFRAPSHHELVGAYADDASARAPDTLRYADPALEPQPNPGEIRPQAIEQVQHILTDYLATDREAIGRWFARYVTEPRAELVALYQPTDISDAAELPALLEQHPGLRRNPAARLAFLRTPTKLLLYADGQEYELEATSEGLIESLCAERRWDTSELGPWTKRPAHAALITELLRRGVLEPADE